MAEADPLQSSDMRSVTYAASDPRVERSKFIDAFAELESVIASAMGAAGLDPKLSASFGQRLDIACQPPSPEKLKKKFESLRAELLSLTATRNALVHSRMEVFALQGGEPDRICFWQVPFGSGVATLLTCAELRQKSGRLRQMCHEIGQLNRPK